MIEIHSNEQAKDLVKNNELRVKGNIELYCDLDIDADIKCRDIVCPEGKKNINAVEIHAKCTAALIAIAMVFYLYLGVFHIQISPFYFVFIGMLFAFIFSLFFVAGLGALGVVE